MKQVLKGALVGVGISTLATLGYKTVLPTISKNWELDSKSRYLLKNYANSERTFEFEIEGHKVRISIYDEKDHPEFRFLIKEDDDIDMYSQEWSYFNCVDNITSRIVSSEGDARNLDYIVLKGSRIDKKDMGTYEEFQDFYENMIRKLYETKKKDDDENLRAQKEHLGLINEKLKNKLGIKK